MIIHIQFVPDGTNAQPSRFQGLCTYREGCLQLELIIPHKVNVSYNAHSRLEGLVIGVKVGREKKWGSSDSVVGIEKEF